METDERTEYQHKISHTKSFSRARFLTVEGGIVTLYSSRELFSIHEIESRASNDGQDTVVIYKSNNPEI